MADTNQTDHILIHKKCKSSLQDVRVFRGADIGSDRFLLMTTLKLKLRKTLFPRQTRE